MIWRKYSHFTTAKIINSEQTPNLLTSVWIGWKASADCASFRYASCCSSLILLLDACSCDTNVLSRVLMPARNFCVAISNSSLTQSMSFLIRQWSLQANSPYGLLLYLLAQTFTALRRWIFFLISVKHHESIELTVILTRQKQKQT